MSKRQQMIALAMDWCYYSTHPQHRMSALAFDGPRLLAGAANSLKTHPKAKTFGNHLHAELALILNSWLSLVHATVVVTRVKKSGALGKSKPCEVCWAALREAGVKYVIYYDGVSWRKDRL